MDNERNQRRFESVYSTKVRAGKRRTYFFDVRQTKGEDYYLTLTESTRRFNGDGYERHKIFLYKEDFNRFISGLEDAVNFVKTELMPDYDYDEYTRRHEEWEAKRAEEGYEYNNENNSGNEENSTEKIVTNADAVKKDVVYDDSDDDSDDDLEDDETEETESKEVESEDDITW